MFSPPGNTPATLLLFKASRRPLYRRQNLHLLAAERGGMVELAWNRSWVAAECYEAGTIEPGTRALVLLTDRPYALFLPVREAEVVEARWEDTSLRLWLALGDWTGPPDGDLAAFTAAVRQADPGAVPGEKFVARRRDVHPLERWYDEREEEGWRRVVDGVLDLSLSSEEPAYARTVFYSPVGVRIGGELHRARREPLPAGEEAELVVGFHNPHLTEAELAGHRLECQADRRLLRVEREAPVLAEGSVAIRLQATGPGGELALRVTPDPAEHPALALRFPAAREGAGAATRERGAGAAGEEGGAGGAGAVPGTRAAGGTTADALLRLYDVVRRSLAPGAERELAVLEAFAVLLPTESRVLERRGMLLAETGNDAAAYETLSALEPERLHDGARFTLFRLSALRGAAPAAAALVAGLDFSEGDVLPRLLAELDRLEPPLLDRIVRELAATLPEEPDVLAVLERTAGRLTSPELIADTARNFFMATGDAARAAAFVTDRRRALRSDAAPLADVLIELADAGAEEPELAGLVSHRVANLLARAQVEEALARLRQATPALPRDERDRVYHRAVDRLVGMGRGGEAVSLLVELAYAALATGDLDAASDAVERATGLAVLEGGPTPELLREATSRVERAWAEAGSLAEWRATDRERRADRLREALLNRRILILGGLKREGHEERLRELTGASVEFGEVFRGESAPLDALAQKIANGSYAAVVFRWQFSGHDVSERLRKECDAAGVPWIYARSGGFRGIEEALAEHFLADE